MLVPNSSKFLFASILLVGFPVAPSAALFEALALKREVLQPKRKAEAEAVSQQSELSK